MTTSVTDAQVRLGVIGCGEHSVTSLQPCIPLVPVFDYIAACDLDPSRAALGLRFGARKTYADYPRMLAEEHLDAVVIVGPAPLHYAAGRACVEAGLHVFIEKPIAPSLADARTLSDAVRASGKVGMTGTMWRHAPAVRTQKRLIEASEFGRPLLFQGTHIAPGYHVRGPGGSGGDSLAWRFMLDQGSHMADCVRFLMGPVENVTAAAPLSQNSEGTYLSALLTFQGGATGTVMFASHAAVMSPTVSVVGQAGQVVTVRNLTQLQIYPLQDDLSGGQHRALTSRAWEHGANYRGISRPGYLEELELFGAAIVGGTPAAPSIEDGWRALELCNALLVSAREGRCVRINQTS